MLKGAQQMIQTLKKYVEKYPDHVAEALYREAQIEATEMKKRTPVDTTPNAPHPGNLRNSIHVLEPERKGRTISVEIVTGTQAPYAVYVHENPDAFHPVGEWKFMESVLNESRPHMASRVARRIHLNRVRL
jgi:hypothetical protein